MKKLTFILSLAFLVLGSQNSFSAQTKWKPLFEKDGVKVFKGKLKGEAVIPFKALAVISGPLEEVVSVLLDFQKKHLWSPKLKSVKTHFKTNEFQSTFSEYYQTPWPASDREFLLEAKMEIKSPHVVKLFAHSSSQQKLADPDHVLAQVNNLDLVLTRLTANKTAIEFTFMGDLKGWIPVWITNLIQRKWPYKFIKGLDKRIKSKKENKENFPLPQLVKNKLQVQELN